MSRKRGAKPRPDKPSHLLRTAATYQLNLGQDDTFTPADGQKIQLGDALHQRFEMLDGNPHDADEYDIENSAAEHWESYSGRMSTIFHLFANEQRNPEIQVNPRDIFDPRATALNNDPFTKG